VGKRHRSARGLILAALLLAVPAGPAAARLRLPPPGDRSVHDLARVLDPASVDLMERRHAELDRKTGAAIVVITVSRLEDETLSDFAVRAGSEWGAGKKGEDRGIVIAITTEEPHIFVAIGYGVEGFLPDGRVGSILDRYAVSPLRARDFSTALVQTSAALLAACAAEYGVTIEGIEPAGRTTRSERGGWRVLLPLLLFVFLLLAFRLIAFPVGRGRRHRGMWYGGGLGGGFGGGFGGGGGGFGGFGGGGFGGGGAGR
jgi:uncharacterized protein